MKKDTYQIKIIAIASPYFFIFLFVSLFFFPLFTFADIYQYFDENGVMHLTDKPHSKGKLIRKTTPSSPIKRYHSPRVLKHRFNRYVDSLSRRYSVDPLLIRAVIQVESAYNHLAVSAKGAKGLMQIMPEIARRYGVKNPFDPYSNIEAGIRYLKYLKHAFDGNLQLAIAAYNCGETRVRAINAIPFIDETQKYVKKVMKLYSRYKLLSPRKIIKYTDKKGVIHLTNRPKNPL